MKLSKFVSFCIFTTFFSVLYVYQQSEIFRLAYLAQKRQSMFQELLDKNTFLRYNIESNASLVRIGTKLSQNQDYEIPANFQLVKLAYPLENLKVNLRAPKKENLIARIFSIKREAQAKTINP
ncbi:MAG: hypothetical protein PHY94_01095 [Candidatus Omnitrophica bacterium]|nr:hypothetical protein [Candidatus Omnitrophota bacterium]